jgi:hypothetical protein
MEEKERKWFIGFIAIVTNMMWGDAEYLVSLFSKWDIDYDDDELDYWERFEEWGLEKPDANTFIYVTLEHAVREALKVSGLIKHYDEVGREAEQGELFEYFCNCIDSHIYFKGKEGTIEVYDREELVEAYIEKFDLSVYCNGCETYYSADDLELVNLETCPRKVCPECDTDAYFVDVGLEG